MRARLRFETWRSPGRGRTAFAEASCAPILRGLPRAHPAQVAEGPGPEAIAVVVMPFTLRVPAFSMAAQQAVISLLEQARRAAHKAVPQVEIVAAGVILYAAAAGAQASLEVSTIGFGSFLGIIVLMWVTFHSLKPIALVMLSIGIGCLGALSVCWLLFERIHLLTLVFGASLIGGAQDYGTYFLCNRIAPDTSALDSWQLIRRLLPALVLTLVTTVIGYMALARPPRSSSTRWTSPRI